jgi:hypothetical protein
MKKGILVYTFLESEFKKLFHLFLNPRHDQVDNKGYFIITEGFSFRYAVLFFQGTHGSRLQSHAGQ